MTSQLSDLYGRTRTLALGVTGLLYSDLSLIIAHIIGSERFRYIYWLAIAGAVVQGALGGEFRYILHSTQPLICFQA